jgi:hypothetical protein
MKKSELKNLEKEIIKTFRILIDGKETWVEKQISEDHYIIGEVNMLREIVIRIGKGEF